MKSLYVSDLDGTLLGNDGTLSSESRASLKHLLADGLAFSVASARSVESMRPVLTGLELSLPVVEFNGAFLSDVKTGRHEVINAIEAEVAEEIHAAISGTGRNPFVSTFDGESDRLYYRQPTNEGEESYVANRIRHEDRRLRPTNDLTRPLKEQVVCLTVIAEAEPLTELEVTIRERFGEYVEIHLFENMYSPGWFWLTVHDHRATKDQAIALMIERYRLDEHDLVVFGDHTNDIKMFEMASEAVAVANAHPEVKRRATQVIGPNHEDSVVGFIREHHAERRK